MANHDHVLEALDVIRAGVDRLEAMLEHAGKRSRAAHHGLEALGAILALADDLERLHEIDPVAFSRRPLH